MPAVLPTAGGGVTRQFLFTMADIVAKVIYGVMITKVAMDLRRAERYGPALAEAGLENADQRKLHGSLHQKGSPRSLEVRAALFLFQTSTALVAGLAAGFGTGEPL
jgi:hypothetical protein